MSDGPIGKRWHTREDSGIRIDKRGQWFHDDEPVEHPNIIEAFNRGLRVNDAGKYELHFGNDWCFVEVADCAFRVVATDVNEGRLSVRLSDRTAEWMDVQTLALDDEGVMTVKVKGGKAKARFSREAQFDLAERFVEKNGRLFLKIGDEVTPLPLGEGLGEGVNA